jgi:hypothetical protein
MPTINARNAVEPVTAHGEAPEGRIGRGERI